MSLIRCPDCGKEFSDSAAACPNCGRPHKSAPKPASKGGCLGIGCLAVVVLAAIGALGIGSGTTSGTSALSSATSAPSAYTPSAATEPQLEVTSWNWSQEYGYATAEGRVTNISNEPLKSVQAVVTWKDKNGEFITSGDALIEYNPVLPGQTSPFKVMARYNPAMRKASLDFKHFFGGSIAWRQRERKAK